MQEPRPVPVVAEHRLPIVASHNYFAEAAQGLDFIEAFTEIKTTWHPIGV